jgi:hypothetical protein
MANKILTVVILTAIGFLAGATTGLILMFLVGVLSGGEWSAVFHPVVVGCVGAGAGFIIGMNKAGAIKV